MVCRLLATIAISPLIIGIAGCGDVEWNWDATWWKRPKRVVKPTSKQPKPAPDRPATPPEQDAAKSRTSPDEDARSEGTEAAARSPTLSEPRAPVRRDAPAGNVSGPTAQVPKPDRRAMPFYQLYLLQAASDQPAAGATSAPTARASEVPGAEADAATGGHRGEYVLELRRASAAACAALLEMLYVPAGRSGSLSECYLLYENFAEFEGAVGFAPNLDLTIPEDASAAVGAKTAFEAGAAGFLRILELGAVVDQPFIAGCERNLAEAAQSAELSPQLRWAAGILAGRLVSDYRYDYAAARSYYRQAERAAAPKSLENMTSRWWLADTFLQEGKAGDADDLYKSLLADYEPKWKDSHIVRRCRAATDHRRK